MDTPADKEIQMIMGSSPLKTNEEAQSPPNSAYADRANNKKEFMKKVREGLKRLDSKRVTNLSRLTDRLNNLRVSTTNRQGTGTQRRIETQKLNSVRKRKKKIQHNRAKQNKGGLSSKLGQPKIW